jgi:hypothetical protein
VYAWTYRRVPQRLLGSDHKGLTKPGTEVKGPRVAAQGKTRGKEPKTEIAEGRLTPEERAELEAMAGTSTLSRFVRGVLRAEQTRAT